MIVFRLLNPNRESTRLDVFVEEPFSFDREYTAARWEEIEGVRSPVVQYSQLIRLKRASGRPQDLTDI